MVFATEPLAAAAFALARDDAALAAPDLVIAETCNAAWQWMRLGRIEPADQREIAARLPRYFAELIGSAALAPRAAALAVQLKHPVHDCFYLALAEARRLPLVTADTRLLAKLGNSAGFATPIHLADYRPRRDPTQPREPPFRA